MKIEEVRPSFTVYLIASDPDRIDGIAESLGLAGYMTVRFDGLTAAFSELHSNPPHFLVFDYLEAGFDLKKAVRQVSAQLPESHVLVATPVSQREGAVDLLDKGVSELLLTPLASSVELVRVFDRFAERDYFMYMNEQLREAPPASAATASSVPDPALSYVRKIFAGKSPDEAIAVFLDWAARRLGAHGALHFKYYANRRVLLAAQKVGIESVEIAGVGVNFNELRPSFRASELRRPQEVEELSTLVHEVFSTEDFLAFPLEVLGELTGTVVFLSPSEADASVIDDELMVLNRALAILESEKRLHVATVKDAHTDTYNRARFIEKLRDEVSRSRRTSMPVALALISVDQYGQLVSDIGQEEAQVVLRMLARIFERHSRVNDILGRTGADEFGLVMPHTGKRGALVKVERLRRIVESADFSRVVASFPQLTISIGVSEYPSMVRDAEELIQAADEALYRIRQLGNRTGVAEPPEGFVPDFEVQEKGLR